MNIDIPTTGNGSQFFFLAKLYLKQGISWEYVMVKFICTGLLDLTGNNTLRKNLQYRGYR